MKFSKESLLEKIKANREEHRAIFVEAQEGYRKAVIEKLEKMIQDGREKKRIVTNIDLQAPIDQTREYDTVIAQLEMTTQAEVELTTREFENYVLDHWVWSDMFYTNNASYSLLAQSKMQQ